MLFRCVDPLGLSCQISAMCQSDRGDFQLYFTPPKKLFPTFLTAKKNYLKKQKTLVFSIQCYTASLEAQVQTLGLWGQVSTLCHGEFGLAQFKNKNSKSCTCGPRPKMEQNRKNHVFVIYRNFGISLWLNRLCSDKMVWHSCYSISREPPTTRT